MVVFVVDDQIIQGRPVPDLSADTYLLQNQLNPFPVASHLELAGSTLTCTLRPMAVEAFTGWIEKAIDNPSVRHQLEAGSAVTVFAIDVNGLEIAWPKQFAGSAMKIMAPDREWLVSLVYPTGALAAVKMFTNRKESKSWRNALIAAGAH